MLALWSMKIIDIRIKVKGKRRERPLSIATNQVEQFYCQPLGQEKGKTYPISTATNVTYFSGRMR